MEYPDVKLLQHAHTQIIHTNDSINPWPNDVSLVETFMSYGE